jgi:hypothetical protein
MNPRRRRLGYVLAAAIAALAVVVAAFPLIQAGGAPEFSGPSLVPRPVIIGLLLGLPAALAAIATLRGSRPIFLTAGVLCLLQSIVGAFSGVTLGFVIPGVLLVALGLERTPASPTSRTSARAWLATLSVVGLGIAAWVAPFATSETVCWVASMGPDGAAVYRRIPESETLTVGLNDIASGCDGGSFTLEGLLLAGFLGVGALAMAGLAAGEGRKPRDPDTALD